MCSVLGTEGHQGPLTCVAANQDGSLILTGSVDCQAKLVSATAGKVRATWSLCCPCRVSPPTEGSLGPSPGPSPVAFPPSHQPSSHPRILSRGF